MLSTEYNPLGMLSPVGDNMAGQRLDGQLAIRSARARSTLHAALANRGQGLALDAWTQEGRR